MIQWNPIRRGRRPVADLAVCRSPRLGLAPAHHDGRERFARTEFFALAQQGVVAEALNNSTLRSYAVVRFPSQEVPMPINWSLAAMPRRCCARSSQGSTSLPCWAPRMSCSSADQVAAELDSQAYRAVAIELCPSRFDALTHPDRLAELDLMQVLRQGKASMVMANLAMAAYQQRLGEQLGIEPGAEMRMAVTQAEVHDLPVVLIDREIGVTLQRTARNLSWWRRAMLFSGLVASLVSREEVSEEDIEHLKEGDVLETTFAEFAHDRDDLYQPLIAERDRYMAAKLRESAQQHPGRPILAVVGAGHLKGIAEHLTDGADPAETLRELDSVAPKARWPRFILWTIVALVLTGFYIGFTRNPDSQRQPGARRH